MNVFITLLTPGFVPPGTQPNSHLHHDLENDELDAVTQSRLDALVASLRQEIGKLSELVIDGKIIWEVRGGYSNIGGRLKVYFLSDVESIRAILTITQATIDNIRAIHGVTSLHLTFTQEFVKVAPQPAHT